MDGPWSPNPAPGSAGLVKSSFGRHTFWLWLGILAILTAASVACLHATGLNPDEGFSAAIIVIAYSPSLAAVLATLITSGPAGLRQLLAPILAWRAGWIWYAIAIIGPFLLIGAANLVFQAAGGRPDATAYFSLSALLAGLGPVLAGSLGEEIGWRGLAQRILQQRYAALTAAVIVGAIWATWHLWPVLAPGGAVHLVPADVFQTYVRLIATAVIYAWIFNSTKGSLLLVMLAHAAHNIAVTLMPPDSPTLALIIAVAYALTACGVVAVSGAKTLNSSWGHRVS